MEQEMIDSSDGEIDDQLSSADMLTFALAEYGASWGSFKFEETFSDYQSDDRPFLYVNENIDLDVLYQFMTTEWKLSPANFIIPILSDIINCKPFKNLKMIEDLRNGIKNTTNASQVWFITNGINIGLPQLIGTALREETTRRRADDAWTEQVGNSPKNRKEFTLLGIACAEEIEDVVSRITDKNKIKKSIKIWTYKRDTLCLNGDHTHFIIIREQPLKMMPSDDIVNKSTITDTYEKSIDIANSAINRFRNRFENFLCKKIVSKTSSSTPYTTTNVQKRKVKSTNEIGIPMVYMMIRGTPGTIEMLYQKLQQEIAVIILKGCGSAADIIAYAYDELSSKKNYEDENLKTELARRLVDEYPILKNNNTKRNEIRDYIMAIVKKGDQNKQKLLSFIDINSSTVSLSNLHKFILSAYLQSKKIIIGNKINSHMQLHLLRLTLDWRLADLTQSEIFQRDDYIGYTIPNSLFEQALLGKNLEAFVDLFLEQNFVLHRYLSPEKLLDLFNEAKDQDFFRTTSLEGILGLSGDDDKVPENFIDHGLNNIVRRLTGVERVFSKYEMQCTANGVYFARKTDKNCLWHRARSEEKALRYLVIYAVLMNRQNLALTLWRRSSEPIPLALICCMMFKRLIPYCREAYQKLLIEKQAKEFSDCAMGVLDKSLKEDETGTFEMLDMRYPDWNYMTIIQLAYNADNKEFMAHAILQKWVVRQLYAKITPRELSWGIFSCPDYLKIIMSAFLIFPMWFWISFSPIGKAPLTSKKKNRLTDSKIDSPLNNGQLEDYIAEVTVREERSCCPRLTLQACRDQRKSINPEAMNCFEKIKTLWSAPITKFYTNFVAYLVFLFFFVLAVMWPSCGHLGLDCVVWLWAASMAFENIRVAYEKYCSQNNLPLKGVIIEIIIQIVFLSLFLSIRIIGLWNFGICDITKAKAILAMGLIYYFYRIVFIFLPISPKIGPMMIRLQYMITDDFFTFLQLFIIFMISSGVAITAVLYPHHPLDWNLFNRAIIFRGLMTLFISDVHDLKSAHQSCTINTTTDIDRKYACLRLSRSFQYNDMSVYRRYGISSPYCNQTSWIAWFLLIQYFFLAKRFLISLLTAMFGLTGRRVQHQSEQIWLYNRYAILIEYAKRPRLPPPFTAISHTIGLISLTYRRCILKVKTYLDNKKNKHQAGVRRVKILTNLIDSTTVLDDGHSNMKQLDISSSTTNNNRSFLERFLKCKPCRKVIESEVFKNDNAQKYWKDSEANTYWKYRTQEYFVASQDEKKTQDKSISEVNVQKDINMLQKSLQQINDRVITLEKMMSHSHVLLEKICATMLQENKSSTQSQKKFIHIHSRDSPYVYTNNIRFPITEKYVPWETPLELYDPTLITLPKEHQCFSYNDRPYVEPNLLKMIFVQPNNSETIDLPTTSTEPNNFYVPVSEYQWNQSIGMQLSDDKKLIVDRTTWITQPNSKTPIIYQVDGQTLVPLNPFGRTGVQGRGALIRWGPNKSIMVVLTRWKKIDNEFITVEGKQLLETMLFINKNTNEWIMPEVKILGEESSYYGMCRNFNDLTFQHENHEHKSSFQERDMISFFKSFAGSSETTNHSTEFESHMVYRGYIDDIRNTDNAWVETEVWNFHYGSTMLFSNLHTDETILWKNVTHNLQCVAIQTSIMREIARIHDAYFE